MSGELIAIIAAAIALAAAIVPGQRVLRVEVRTLRGDMHGLETNLTGRMNLLETDLTARMAELDTGLTRQMTRLETTLTERVARLEGLFEGSMRAREREREPRH
ncbi:hypothetical protein [Candidatus Palauibacter sp.]|uniref:hypothetical protein n=1 Tax=Candidatus Palauibacter sp. TaxID=3101350 RepID=UPI003AF213F3